MARITESGFLSGLMPRYPLEMVAASLATFLATAVWFDLPHRTEGAEPPPAAEKLTRQAEPLPIRMFRPSEEHEASAFMEAVALSHVAPLLPQGEVDRAAAEPPPAVQVLARSPSHDKAKLAVVAAAVPQPAPRPVARAVAPAPAAVPQVTTVAAVAPILAAPADLRPPGQIPAVRPVSHSRFDVPVVGDLARSARTTVTDGIDSLGRGVRSLVGWR